jgi:hypothetical protein
MHKRDEIIAAIQRCAAKLGRAPSQAEFRKTCKISWYQIYKDFRGMRQAVRAAGLEPGPRGGPLDVNALVLDWARVVRELGRLPSRAEYSQRGVHHAGTLHARVGWSQMAHKFVLVVREFHLEREWADVVEIVCKKYALLKMVGGDRVIGRSGDRVIGNAKSEPAADERRWAQIGQEGSGRELTRMDANQNREPQRSQRSTEEEPQPRAAVLHEYGCGMRLGRVVSAGLALQILMATMASGQAVTPGRVKTLESMGEGVNTSVAEAGIIEVSAAGINACSTPLDTASSSELTKAGATATANACSTPLEHHESSQARVSRPQQMESHDLPGTPVPVPQSPRQAKVMYGAPLQNSVMTYAPTNEAGVILLFGSLAAGMGFRIERLQAAFPDCKAKREVVPGKWEDVLIEFEFESRNFKEHRHDPAGCDVIVCWRHNWPDCPEWLEVIELCNEVM